MSIWEQLTGYLSFSFVQYALIAGVLIALCSSLLGVTLVLKRFSVIGDGLSHVAFGALAIATVLRHRGSAPEKITETLYNINHKTEIKQKRLTEKVSRFFCLGNTAQRASGDFVRYCLYSVFSPAWTACDFTSSHRYDWRMPPDLLPACRQSAEPDRTAALRSRPALHCRWSGVPSDADRSGVPD